MLSIKLRELRKKNGLSQAELGEALGLTNNAISKYECAANKPDPDTLCRFADFFCVSVDYLLGRVDEDRSNVVKTGIVLAEDEQELIDYYRSCSSIEKKYILSKAMVCSVEGLPEREGREADTGEEGKLLA